MINIRTQSAKYIPVCFIMFKIYAPQCFKSVTDYNFEFHMSNFCCIHVEHIENQTYYVTCNKSFIKETTRLLRLSGWIKAMYADLYMSKSYIKSKRVHS